MGSWDLGITSLEDGENANRATKVAHKARLCPSIYKVTFGYTKSRYYNFPLYNIPVQRPFNAVAILLFMPVSDALLSFESSASFIFMFKVFHSR